MDMMRSTEPVDLDHVQLKNLRTAANLTGAELARSAGIDRRNYYSIEAGRRGVSFETLLALADALNLPDPVNLMPPGAPTLQRLRLRQRLTRTQLADKADVSYHLIFKVESGSRRLTDELTKRLADILKVDPADVQTAATVST